MRIVYATREGVFPLTDNDAGRITFFVGDAALITDERWTFAGGIPKEENVPDQDHFNANDDR